jgi:hypothetical protein
MTDVGMIATTTVVTDVAIIATTTTTSNGQKGAFPHGNAPWH